MKQYDVQAQLLTNGQWYTLLQTMTPGEAQRALDGLQRDVYAYAWRIVVEHGGIA